MTLGSFAEIDAGQEVAVGRFLARTAETLPGRLFAP
jgi:hypothetical protein